MDINIALDNFKRAYNDLIDALEQPKASEYQIVEKEGPLNKYMVTSDIGQHFYFAKNETNAKNQFRARHGFNYIKIHRVNLVETNVDNGKQL